MNFGWLVSKLVRIFIYGQQEYVLKGKCRLFWIVTIPGIIVENKVFLNGSFSRIANYTITLEKTNLSYFSTDNSDS